MPSIGLPPSFRVGFLIPISPLKTIQLWGFLLFSCSLFAQSNDSLVALLPQTRDTARVHILNQLAKKWRYESPDSALFYARWALRSSQELNYVRGIASSEIEIGSAFYMANNRDSAKLHLERGRSIAEANDLDRILATSCLYLGAINLGRGLNLEALELFERSLNLYLKVGDSLGQLMSHNNISSVLTSTANYSRAIQHLFKSRDLAEKLKKPHLLGTIYNNIGRSYENIDDFRQALKYYEMALPYFTREGEYLMGTATLFCNIGDLSLRQGNFASARKNYKKAIEVGQKQDEHCAILQALLGLGTFHLQSGQPDSALYQSKRAWEHSKHCHNKAYHFHNLVSFGRAYLELGQFEIAEKYLLQSLDSIPGDGDPRLFDPSDAYNALSTLYETRENYGKALYYFKLFKTHQDSIFNDRNKEKLTRVEMSSEFEKERAILMAQQEGERILLESRMAHIKTVRNYFVAGFILFALLTYLMYVLFRKKKSAHVALAERNTTILRQQGELMEQAELLKEKNRKITELSRFKEGLAHMAVHDMKNPLNAIIGLSSGKPSAHKSRIINLSSLKMLNFITNMLNIYKFEQADIVLDLQQFGLWVLVNESVNEVEVLTREKDQRIQNEVSRSLLVKLDKAIFGRVLVNLFTNAIKYSPAGGTIVISAEKIMDTQGLRIIVRDEGKGIPPEKIPGIFEQFNKKEPQYINKSASTGIGLSFCKLAVKAHEGTIKATSQMGEGTSVIIDLPPKYLMGSPNGDDSSGLVTKNRETLILKEEAERIKNYATKLRKYKVYEVGKINRLIKEMEEEGLGSAWIKQVRQSVYSGNEDLFQSILMEAQYES